MMTETTIKLFRRFAVERSYYYDTHDGDGNLKENALTEKEWKEQIIEEWLDLCGLNADEILFIFHDADIGSDGVPKGLHAHAVVHFINGRRESAVMELMGASRQQNCKHVKNYAGSVQYLLHITQDAINDMKTIYTPDKIIGYALDENGDKVRLTVRDIQQRMRRASNKQKAEEETVKSELLEDVLTGRKLASNIRDDYRADEQGTGLNLVKYYKEKAMYMTAERDYLETCARFYQLHEHPSTLIYITGAGGKGKSTLANALAVKFADVRGVHQVGNPGKSTTFDFVSSYNGQKVSLFDETPPLCFTVEQFLDIYNPLRATIVNSRHSDKPYFAEVSIFANSMPFEKFLYTMWKEWAQANSAIPPNVRRQLKADSSERDWHDSYIKFALSSDVGNKLMQIRRRFAIVCNITDDDFLEVGVFDKNQNPAYSLLFYDDYCPFPAFRTIKFSLMHDADKTLELAVTYVEQAIDEYYSKNGFKHPDEYEKPFDNN